MTDNLTFIYEAGVYTCTIDPRPAALKWLFFQAVLNALLVSFTWLKKVTMWWWIHEVCDERVSTTGNVTIQFVCKFVKFCTFLPDAFQAMLQRRVQQMHAKYTAWIRFASNLEHLRNLQPMRCKLWPFAPRDVYHHVNETNSTLNGPQKTPKDIWGH